MASSSSSQNPYANVPQGEDEGTKGKYFVNQYEVSRCYGGPEEGGWWFNRGEFIHCLAGPFTREEDALKWWTRWKQEQEQAKRSTPYKMGHGPHDGVDPDGYGDDNYLLLGGAWGHSSLRTCVQPHEGKNYPETRPFYC